MDGPGARKSKLAGSDLIDWFEAGARSLVETIRSTDPTAPCPNFNPGSPSLSQWWFRRQLHETMVHRWDIERAFDDTTAIVGSIAVDGVDEFLDTFVRTRGKQSLTAPLTITSRKPERSWTLRPAAKPGRLDVAPGGAEDAVQRVVREDDLEGRDARHLEELSPVATAVAERDAEVVVEGRARGHTARRGRATGACPRGPCG